MNKFAFSFVFIFTSVIVFAQPAERRISRTEYVDQWSDVAIQHMHEYGIPASITLAQGILESASGNSSLAKYANNHFGIKCHDWQGDGFYKDDDKKDECFRRYLNASESYKDHAEFLKNRSRYASLFELKTTDYKNWAKGLRKAGYATNPKYADLLIQIIEDHELYLYDQMMPMQQPVASLDQQKQEQIVKYQWHKVIDHYNKIKCVKVKEGDTVYKIAKEFDMNMWQIYKYNDFEEKQDILKVGAYVYLQPKRNKARKNHGTIKVNEDINTLREISQLEGIKLKKLVKKNDDIDPDAVLLPGTEVALR